MDDDNPRPVKRARHDSSFPSEEMLSSQSTLTPLPSPESSSPRPALKPLPPHILLVSLPSLLAVPPNHRSYIQSLILSLIALRKCLSLPALSPEIECRAWCGLAEIGMKAIDGGFTEDSSHMWARGIESEVDKALSKAALIAQKHPSLRSFKIHLSLLQAQLSQWQHKYKFARTQIRSLLSSFQPTDAPYIVYSAHLAAISMYSAPNSPSTVLNPSQPTAQFSSYNHGTQDINAALSALQDMEDLSLLHGHTRITLLAQVLRLRMLIAAGIWNQVPSAICNIEYALGLSYNTAPPPVARQPSTHLPQTAQPTDIPESQNATFIFFESPFEAAIAVHTILMTVIYFTHTGSATEVSPRLSHLHALLDSGALEKFPDGTVEVSLIPDEQPSNVDLRVIQAKLPGSPPLAIQVTHPRILFLLGFLVSSVAKRDAVGRKPKRKVFANEGISAWDRDVEQELTLPLWSSQGDIEEIEQRLARIKGDLLCELIAVSIMRSEFDVAEQNLDTLIAHTRTYSIFPNFSARITLHQAHLAHALCQIPRALSCYRVAARLAVEDDFVRLAAQAGEIILLMGLRSDKAVMSALATGIHVDHKEAVNIAKACRGMGGTLEAMGQVVEALMSPEILRSKEHLKLALELASKAQDNHLRAVVIAIVAAHYFHTAGDHAFKMLMTCEQLAAGLGASNKNLDGAVNSVGNAQLGLWVGQKFLELYKRAGKEERIQKQIVVNQRLEEAVTALAARGKPIGRGDSG
ncbi:hypothetical protein BDW22DRAFT_1424406 [Trametopsis cervina]|nr:hypothetical protein BDW22DRAFT_1424406 [Trametopsis cervina]